MISLGADFSAEEDVAVGELGGVAEFFEDVVGVVDGDAVAPDDGSAFDEKEGLEFFARVPFAGEEEVVFEEAFAGEGLGGEGEGPGGSGERGGGGGGCGGRGGMDEECDGDR